MTDDEDALRAELDAFDKPQSTQVTMPADAPLPCAMLFVLLLAARLGLANGHRYSGIARFQIGLEVECPAILGGQLLVQCVQSCEVALVIFTGVDRVGRATFERLDGLLRS